MYLFFEKGMKGGVSSFLKNIAKPTNNQHLKSYDPKQELKHIVYLDANNLYGYAMSQFLPKSEFKWIDTKEFDLNIYNSNSSKGCVLEVNHKYPKELRKLQDDRVSIISST